jgi:5-methylthioadenosine/S-adenosylhomocysteine deaminase
MGRSTGFSLALLFTLAAACVSPAKAQWTPDTTIVLRGKIVTMTGTVRNGQIVIKNGTIQALQSATTAVPQGAVLIETRGYIYPGLMNLHDHLEYNMVPLYSVPRHFDNHDQWPGGKAYETGINNPWKVATDGNIFNRSDEAFKLAEVRTIIGGCTTTQGADNNPAISTTLVRNVELANFGEDTVGQRSLTIDRLFWEHLPEQIDRIKAQKAWIFHMGEGIDEYSRQEFSNPAFDPSQPLRTRNRPGVVQANLLWPGLVGVHCTALTEADFRQWKEATGQPKIVWSPTSNLLLYGKTTDIAAALRQNALIAIGTDWAPSGSKNMLWELKTVDQYNRTALNGLLTDQQIVEMCTVNAARLVGWEARVGSIRPGMVADLVVVDDTGAANGYRNLIQATETHVQLVLVGGDPLYGDERHMRRLKTYDGQPRYEVLPETQGARPKAIDMLQNPEVRNGELSVADLRERLTTAMNGDPAALAERLNEGERESATKTTYKGRDYVKAELIKLLTRANRPVPASLRDPASRITEAQARDFIELKYPNLKNSPKVLETLYTDRAWAEGMEANVHFRDGTSPANRLRYGNYLGSTPGLVNSIPGQ